MVQTWVAATAGEFFTNLVTGVKDGDPLALVIVGIVALVILRFVLARWMWTLVKQAVIFGGLAYGVYRASGALTDRGYETIGLTLRYGGFAVLAILLFAMLYMFFLRRAREKDAADRKAGKVSAGETGGGTTMRVGGGPLKGQGLPVTHEATKREKSPASAGPDDSPGRLEDVLSKVNVLGASKDQNILTVFVLIMVAEFGVFTSKTIPAPNAQIGMVLFGIFLVAAVVFVKTSYKNYWTGVRHFVFATVFALVLAVVMLAYWQAEYCDADQLAEGETVDECPDHAMEPLTLATATNPNFFFASDGLIAAITGVAFSTLLTKGGG